MPLPSGSPWTSMPSWPQEQEANRVRMYRGSPRAGRSEMRRAQLMIRRGNVRLQFGQTRQELRLWGGGQRRCGCRTCQEMTAIVTEQFTHAMGQGLLQVEGRQRAGAASVVP